MAELTVPQVNFSALGQLPQVYRQAQQEQLRRQTLADLGQGGAIDANTLLRSGDLSLAQLGIGLQNRQQDQARQAAQDEESKRRFALTYGLQARAAQRADEGPVETAAQRAKAASQYGLTPDMPEFKSYVLGGQLPAQSTAVGAQVEQRKQAALANGLDPSSPGYQSFVLTGKMPREDAQPLTAGDKEAIRAADDAVIANKAAIDSLGRAKQFSKEAFAGPAAGGRGYAASFLGSSSDIGRGGIATENLTNEVMTNALGQLKAIFGGNPTEGERKILLDLQGSVTKPDVVRQAIFDRAQAAARNRLEFNQKRADELRGGTYYKPPGSMSRAPVAQTQGITQAQYEALPSGTPFTAPDGSQRIKP